MGKLFKSLMSTDLYNMFMGVYILIMKLFRCATLHCSSHPKGYRVARCKHYYLVCLLLCTICL
jgi:hypothetical protein